MCVEYLNVKNRKELSEGLSSTVQNIYQSRTNCIKLNKLHYCHEQTKGRNQVKITFSREARNYKRPDVGKMFDM